MRVEALPPSRARLAMRVEVLPPPRELPEMTVHMPGLAGVLPPMPGEGPSFPGERSNEAAVRRLPTPREAYIEAGSALVSMQHHLGMMKTCHPFRFPVRGEQVLWQ